MAIVTTSGFPSDQVGATGDYAIDPVAHFIYGPKTSTWSGTASSLQGPSGPGMVYGTGAPTSAQGAIGQGYVDLASGNFYGPKASNGAWGNAVSKITGAAGLSVLTGAGAPASTLGLDGQVYIDTQAYNIYTRASGAWGTATSLVGPAGNAPVMTSLASVYGPGAQFAGQTMGTSTTAANSIFMFNGSTIPYTFTPQYNSALTGLQVTNYSVTGATVYFYLNDLTSNSSVYGYNAGNGIAAGTIAALNFSNTAYPLTAGHTYQWGGIRGSAGATTMQINPLYLVPSGTPSSLSYYANFSLNSSTSVASKGSVITYTPGMTQQGYYRNANPSYVYYMEYWIAGSGQAGPYIYNSTASANQLTLDNYGGYPTLSSTLTRYIVGPFASTAWPFTPNSTYIVSIYAPNGASTVTQFFCQLIVGQ